MYFLQQRKLTPNTQRIQREQRKHNQSGPKSLRLNDNSLPIRHSNASSQTDLVFGIEDSLIRSLHDVTLQSILLSRQTQKMPIITPQKPNTDRFSPFQIRQKLLKRPIIQNKNRIITIVVVNNGGQFIQFLLNRNYFEQQPDQFFSNNHHTSFYLTTATIQNCNSQNSINSYQDILMVNKKSRAYDSKFNRLSYDNVTQSFIQYCPDLLIVSIGNLNEELSKRKTTAFYSLINSKSNPINSNHSHNPPIYSNNNPNTCNTSNRKIRVKLRDLQ